MIEKMQFLSISGPRDDIDRVAETYLSRYEIQLEHALTELGSRTGLKPFIEENPYKEALAKSSSLLEAARGESAQSKSGAVAVQAGRGAAKARRRASAQNAYGMDAKEAAAFVAELAEKTDALFAERAELEKQLSGVRLSEEQIMPFRGLNYNLERLKEFRAIKFRFGKMPKEYFKKFQEYVYDTLDTILMKCGEDKDNVWLVYFVPVRLEDKIDAVYTSMHFERFYMPEAYIGTPDEVIEKIDRHMAKLKQQMQEVEQRLNQLLGAQKNKLEAAHEALAYFTENFEIRKYAACSKHDEHTFYFLCGWITEHDAKRLRRELDKDDRVYCLVEKDHAKLQSQPPTKLKNPRILKPFEMYIRMYGLPAYGELDPTLLVALTYSVMFGFMFGDVGQGLCLLVGGLLLYRLKGMMLAGIIASCGVFSTLFGFLFGSFFGFEDVIEARWLRPSEAMTKLPFIGNLNTVFVVAIAIGMGIILLTMLLNIVNSIRRKDVRSLLFSTNGAAGLVFYGALVVTVALYMSGNALPATALILVLFGIPLVLLFFQEPLAALVERKKAKLEGGAGMFVVQGFFELFEVMLSYFSNTLSFVRVGAFAVSHAAMMQVVLMLAGAESGTVNWLVVVLGNLFVCGMEGLIVGIQVLRLEYYELFSRFYAGTGRAFEPYGKEAA